MHNYLYLPHTYERLQRLKSVVNKRPIAILLPGPSIEELEEHIAVLGEYDICYATVNNFPVLEDKLLKQIAKQFEIVMCSAKENNVPSAVHCDYLDRPVENVFISETAAFHRDMERFMKKYDERLLFFVAERGADAFDMPTPDYPLHFLAQSSLGILLPLLLIGEPSLIIIFGDGGMRDSPDPYYTDWTPNIRQGVSYDARVFDHTIPFILSRVIKLFDIPMVRIMNCMDSLESPHQVFKTATHKQVLEVLNADLR